MLYFISSDSLIVHYEYDELNQLKRENNAYLNKTITYQYDDGGNIQSKAVYALTLGNSDLDLDVLTPESTVNYGYADENWKDKLTSYNGQNITYDSIGNPFEYLNGWTFDWKNGRQLDKMVNSGYNVNVSCKYDEGSVRTQKTVKSIKDGNEITKTTDFITDGIQILSQKTTTVVTDIATGNQVADPATDTIIWQIDGEGTVLGFIHNNGVYYYLKNAQGDIVGIADKDSNIVANYTYDSWGKLVSIIDPSQDNLDVTGDTNHIGYINPLRYRGYYYDSETGLYYLNARYYDPETGRFINSDDNLEGGLNLFEYCHNNPVIFSDFDGNKSYVFYYDVTNKGFKDQAMNSEYYDSNDSEIEMCAVTNINDFVKSWNNMDDANGIEKIYIFVHGCKSMLCFKDGEIDVTNSSSFSKLNSKNVNNGISIFSCHAGDGKEDENVAWALAKLTKTKALACSGCVSFDYDNVSKIYTPRKSLKDFGVFKTFWYDEVNGQLVSKHAIGVIK